MPRWLVNTIIWSFILIFVFYPKIIQDGGKIIFSSSIETTKHTLVISQVNKKSPLLTLTVKPEIVPYINTTQSQGLISNNRLGQDLSELSAVNANLIVEEHQITERKKHDFSKVKQTHWQLNITFDNDIFANRDYYYTNGVRIEFVAPFANASPLNKILFSTKNKDIQLSGFSVIQNIYTPTNPDTSLILYGDHPFSAYLTIGQFRETYDLTRKIHIKSEFDIGVIGPASFGGQVQSSIHEIEPVGWRNQVKNDIVINYSFMIEKGLLHSSLFELNTLGRASVGTLYNKAGGGLNLRFGKFLPFYHGPSSIFENKNPGGRYQFWIFSKTIVDFIAYDATLQGGMFTQNNPYVLSGSDINRLVLQASVGVAIYYNSIGLEYEHIYLSPRFKGANHFGWGSIKATFAF